MHINISIQVNKVDGAQLIKVINSVSCHKLIKIELKFVDKIFAANNRTLIRSINMLRSCFFPCDPQLEIREYYFQSYPRAF